MKEISVNVPLPLALLLVLIVISFIGMFRFFKYLLLLSFNATEKIFEKAERTFPFDET